MQLLILMIKYKEMLMIIIDTVVVCFLIYRKHYFDTVDHQILLRKRHSHYGIRGKAFDIFQTELQRLETCLGLEKVDTIFQSLGLEGVKSRSRDLEVSENERVSRLFLQVRFKIE